MRYFLELSYKGSSYNGWQRQQNAPSVQQAIEESLSTLLRCEIAVTGAGRTDTGVHASCYVAHFDVAQRVDCPAKFLYHLNSILPPDIAVQGVTAVPAEAHARFDAVQREYRYHLLPRKDPFRRDSAWICFFPLDVEAMNAAAAALPQAEDFTTFSKLHSDNKSNICHVSHAAWERLPDGELVFTIRADRFLRGMVRAIVGTLVDVGRGRLTPQEFAERLAAADRSLASGLAPAQGLFMSGISYPENIFKQTLKLH